MDELKCLSMTNPWACLVALGTVKRFETRNWSTPHRGQLAIQAAKTMPDWAIEACYEEPFSSQLARYLRQATWNLYDEERLPKGLIIAVVDLVDCQQITWEFRDALSDQERAFGNYEIGRWAWEFANARRLPTPVPVRGQPIVWSLDPTARAAVERQLAQVVA